MRIKLSKEEQRIFNIIMREGSIDEMFYFGYVVGRERLSKENLDLLDKK